MSKTISNDENIRNLKIRKILRIVIIIFSLITIGLSILSIIYSINIIYPLLAFILTHILMKIRDNTVINKKDDLENIRNMLNKNKRK